MVASGQIVLGILARDCGKRPTGCRCDVPAARHRAPEGVLQPFGEGHIAFAAQDDVGMLEAGIGQSGSGRDGGRATCRRWSTARSPISVKSDRPIRPGSWTWPKDDLLVRAVDGAPGADPTLRVRRTPAPSYGMAPQNLLENGDTGRSPRPPPSEDRHDLSSARHRRDGSGRRTFATDTSFAREDAGPSRFGRRLTS